MADRRQDKQRQHGKQEEHHLVGTSTGLPSRRPELRTLTSLRFLAALAVFVDHGCGALWPYLTGGHWHYVLRLGEQGGAGVTFFFILSGFILTYNYQDRLESAGDRARFWLARFGRVYPVHLLTLCLAAPAFVYVYVVYHHWRPAYLGLAGLANLFLVQAWIPVGGDKYVTTFDGPSWTLACEMFFYALLPLILFVVARLRRRGTWPLVALGLGAWLGTLALVVLLHHNLAPWVAWVISVNPASRLVEFLVGVLAGTIFLGRQQRGQVGGYRTSVELGSLLLLLASAPLCLRLLNQQGSVGLNVLYVPFMLLVIWVFAQEGGRLSQWLSKDRYVYLGEISFSFYMIHFLLIEWLIWPAQIGWPLSVPIVLVLLGVIFVLTLAASALLFRWFEGPARRLIRGRGDRWLDGRAERQDERRRRRETTREPLPKAAPELG